MSNQLHFTSTILFYQSACDIYLGVFCFFFVFFCFLCFLCVYDVKYSFFFAVIYECCKISLRTSIYIGSIGATHVYLSW
jgi:hypothetical protein